MGRHWQLLHITAEATLGAGAGTEDTAAAGAAATTPATGGVAATVAETAAAGASSVAEKGRWGGMLMKPMGLYPEQH